MRLLYAVCFLSLLVSVHAAQLTGFVNDEAGLFTPEEEQAIAAIAQELYGTNRAQYAVVTVNSLDGRDIESYSIDLVQGRLGDTELDNGLLLLIAPNERQYRFEVGSGLEGTLNDARVGRIGRTYLVDAFRQEQYGAGVIAASSAIRDILVEGVEPQELQEQDYSALQIALPIILWIIFVIIMSLMRKRRKKKEEEDTFWDAALAAAFMFGGRGGGGDSGGGFGGGGFSGGGGSGGW